MASLESVAPVHRQEQEAYIDTYAELVRPFDFVKAVYADHSDDLTIYTVYQGDLDRIDDELYDAYGTVIDRFPGVAVNFRLLDGARVDDYTLPYSACLVFARQ